MLIVCLATNVLKTVGDYDIVHVKKQVVGEYLVENTMSQRHTGGLVFDDHLRLEVPII